MKKVDVEKAAAELGQCHAWDWLGSEAELIREALAGFDPDTGEDEVTMWYEYLQAHLKFPFEARVDEHQDRGPLHFDDRVRVHELTMADDLYGVIVRLRLSRNQYALPLADLAVLDENSENHALVQAYRVWFANR